MKCQEEEKYMYERYLYKKILNIDLDSNNIDKYYGNLKNIRNLRYLYNLHNNIDIFFYDTEKKNNMKKKKIQIINIVLQYFNININTLLENNNTIIKKDLFFSNEEKIYNLFFENRILFNLRKNFSFDTKRSYTCFIKSILFKYGINVICGDTRENNKKIYYYKFEIDTVFKNIINNKNSDCLL
jgi:hypothetical protein